MADTEETARTFADVRDFPIYLSHMDENTRLWFAPWRVWDGATFVVGVAATAWATYHWLDSGWAIGIAFWGLAITGGLTWLARQMPISRPTPLYRMWWLLNSVVGTQRRAATSGRRDPWLSPPKAVIDNLVFTRGGVFAEFLLAGQPGGMMPYERKRAIANGHRPLVRQLPSGLVFWGVCVRMSQQRINERMLTGYETRPDWVGEVRDWEGFLEEEPFFEQVFGVRVPVDAGLAGRTAAGALAKAWKTIIGYDYEDPGTLAGYRELAAEVMAKIPEGFAARPATPRQIAWLYHRRWTLGTADVAFPHGPGGPDRLTAADFADAPADFDEGDQQSRRQHRSWLRRHLPSMKPVLRIESATGVQSYQAMLPVAELPRAGLAYPRAEYLLSVYDVDVPASVDWHQHVAIRSREKALNRIDWAQRNLSDQSEQRGGVRASRSDLARRYDSAEDYAAELESSALESEAEWTTVVSVGSPSPQATMRATQLLRTHLAEELQTHLAQRSGNQRALWQLGAPGSEERAPRSQFCQPTTTRHWARFAPLTSAELGNETGILFARNLATRRPGPVFVDLEGAPERRDAPGMLWIGPPGGGKSENCKRVVDGLLKRRSQCSIIDPGTLREWVPALAHHGDRVVVIDPTKGKWSLDPLRMFPQEVAVEHTLDHVCPMMGLRDDSMPADDLRYLLRPGHRVAKSLGELRRWVTDNRKEYPELAAKFNSWADVDYLGAMWDESLPVPPIAEKDATIWLTADLELPDVAETDNIHLYERQSRRARAGFAVYGMIAAITRHAYTGPNRRGGFGWMVCEEARTYFQSPVGRKDIVRTVTQGRKEHYGLLAIDQAGETFNDIGSQYLPMRVITPFKPTEREYARQAFRRLGIDPDEYPEVLETRTVDGHGYAYFIDHAGRAGLVDLLQPVQPELVEAFDTRHLMREAALAGAVDPSLDGQVA
jgi:AAA-like domain